MHALESVIDSSKDWTPAYALTLIIDSTITRILTKVPARQGLRCVACPYQSRRRSRSLCLSPSPSFSPLFTLLSPGSTVSIGFSPTMFSTLLSLAHYVVNTKRDSTFLDSGVATRHHKAAPCGRYCCCVCYKKKKPTKCLCKGHGSLIRGPKTRRTLAMRK